MLSSKLKKRLFSLLFLVSLLGVSSPAIAQESFSLSTVSISSQGIIGNGWSDRPSISSDGRFVAFESTATNLVPDDTNGVADIFFHDRQNGTTMRISNSTDGVQANALSSRPAVSGNGRFVAFESLANNLVPDDSNGLSDIFVHDRLSGATRRISVNVNGVQSNGWSERPSISHDGRFIAFVSTASDLVPDDTNGLRDVFIHDQVTGNIIRASVSTQGFQANGASGPSVALSSDGRFVTFNSLASNLVLDDTNGVADIFVYHRVLGEIERVSISPEGFEAESPSDMPTISSSGGYVAFTSSSKVLASNDAEELNVFLHRRKTGEIFRAFAIPSLGNQLNAVLSEDAGGLTVRMGSDSEIGELRWIDLQTNQSVLVHSGVVGNEFDLSRDGQVVAFVSIDLASSGSNTNQIFVADSREDPAPTFVLGGRVTDEVGSPLGLVTITDNFGFTTRTDRGGYFFLNGYPQGEYSLTAFKEGYDLQPSPSSLELTTDILAVNFTPYPQDILTEARKDIGMPYSFDRGCEDPYKGCGGRFHGFSAGYCTDLVLDAYWYGADFNIQFALEQDAKSHPDHYYRWRDARNTHDMWRYFHYSGQMLPHEEPYQPGDIVFFDWIDDGEVDHVALVSEVDGENRPQMMVDATGVIDLNPSGLAAELSWENFHEHTVRGHARWSGTYEPYVVSFPEGIQVLQMALGSEWVNLRVVDDTGNALSYSEKTILGGSYLDMFWEETIGIVDPLSNAERYVVEINGHNRRPASYQFTVQTMQDGLITGRIVANDVLFPGEVRRIPLALSEESGRIKLSAINTKRQPKIRGVLRKH